MSSLCDHRSGTVLKLTQWENSSHLSSIVRKIHFADYRLFAFVLGISSYSSSYTSSYTYLFLYLMKS